MTILLGNTQSRSSVYNLVRISFIQNLCTYCFIAWKHVIYFLNNVLKKKMLWNYRITVNLCFPQKRKQIFPHQRNARRRLLFIYFTSFSLIIISTSNLLFIHIFNLLITGNFFGVSTEKKLQKITEKKTITLESKRFQGFPLPEVWFASQNVHVTSKSLPSYNAENIFEENAQVLR